MNSRCDHHLTLAAAPLEGGEDRDVLEEEEDLADGDEDEEVAPAFDLEDFSGVFSAFGLELRELLSPLDLELSVLDLDPSAFDLVSSLSLELEDERLFELSSFEGGLSFDLLDELVLCFLELLELECFFLLSDSFDLDDELCLSEE